MAENYATNAGGKLAGSLIAVALLEHLVAKEILSASDACGVVDTAIDAIGTDNLSGDESSALGYLQRFRATFS